MNLIRLIKLKKINGELDGLTQMQLYYLSFFNNLIKMGNEYCHIDEDLLIPCFEIDEYHKTIQCSYSMVYLSINIKYNNNHNDILNFYNHILHDILNINEYKFVRPFII